MNRATPPRTNIAVLISLVIFKLMLVYKTYKLNVFFMDGDYFSASNASDNLIF